MLKNKISCICLIIVFGLPLSVVAAQDIQDERSVWRMETQGWSIEEHRIAAKEEEQAVESLEHRVQNVEQRISRLKEKPYFDPKGINRSALKNLSGKLKAKMN